MKASKRRKKASPEGRVEPKLDSVYDFIYVDSRRVALLLSQFDESGNVQQIEQSETFNETSEDSGNRNIAAKVGPLSWAMGGGNTAMEARGGGVKRTYDPQWTNVLEVLAQLERRNLLQRDIKAARIGQIGSFRGSLTILNAALLQAVLLSPFVREQITSQQITTSAH